MKRYKSLIKVVAKTSLLATPFIFLLTIYFVKDPYMVLREYEDYDHPVLNQQNIGYIMWHKFLKYNPEKHYDSFIMGASATLAFTCDEWNKHIKCSPIRTISFNEGLYNNYARMKALDEMKGQKIKNVLIITDSKLLPITEPQEGVSYDIGPNINGISWFKFHTNYIKSFLVADFFVPYLRYLFTGYYDKGSNAIINNRVKTLEKYTNDAAEVKVIENLIAQKGFQFFFKKNKEKFEHALNLKPKMLPPRLGKPQINILKALKQLANKHKTNLKLVIAPRLNKDYINDKDFALLQQILGKENVFSYEVNVHKELNKIENFYEPDHFRESIGQYILNDIYGNAH